MPKPETTEVTATENPVVQMLRDNMPAVKAELANHLPRPMSTMGKVLIGLGCGAVVGATTYAVLKSRSNSKRIAGIEAGFLPKK